MKLTVLDARTGPVGYNVEPDAPGWVAIQFQAQVPLPIAGPDGQPVTVATEAIVVVLPEAHARELARRIDGKPPIVLANGGAR